MFADFGVTLRGFLLILLVEDERKIAKALQEGLGAESYSIAVAHNGQEGFQRVSSEPFDLAVLDVMLPGPERDRDAICDEESGN